MSSDALFQLGMGAVLLNASQTEDTRAYSAHFAAPMPAASARVGKARFNRYRLRSIGSMD